MAWHLLPKSKAVMWFNGPMPHLPEVPDPAEERVPDADESAQEGDENAAEDSDE